MVKKSLDAMSETPKSEELSCKVKIGRNSNCTLFYCYEKAARPVDEQNETLMAVEAHKQKIATDAAELSGSESGIEKLKTEPFNRDVDRDIDDLEQAVEELEAAVKKSKMNQVDEKTKVKIRRALDYYVEVWRKRKR